MILDLRDVFYGQVNFAMTVNSKINLVQNDHCNILTLLIDLLQRNYFLNTQPYCSSAKPKDWSETSI